MLVVHSPDHGIHHGCEIHRGQVAPAFEAPRRAEAILARARAVGIGPIIRAREFGNGPILRVHDPEYITFLDSAHDRWCHERGPGNRGQLMPNVPWPSGATRRYPVALQGQINFFSADVCVSIGEGTWKAARASAQAALTAACELREGLHSAFALCRPPGHHAGPARMAGYCYLNNAAIAAQDLADHDARIAILDLDYHHGNGTQEIFADREDVLFVSVHADPASAYPYFAGYQDEVGVGPGEGYTANYPLPIGTAWRGYSDALKSALARITSFGPDIVVVSLGVDTYEQDPIGQFCLQLSDYFVLGRLLAGLGRPTLFVMEGGYAAEDEALGAIVVNVLSGFEDR